MQYYSIRFVKPVFIGDAIHIKVTIQDRRAHKMLAHGILRELREVTDQRLETLRVCEHLLLVKMQEPENLLL